MKKEILLDKSWNKNKVRYIHHTYRKINIDKLLKMVRKYILNTKSDRFFKEKLSIHFNVKEQYIEQCLNKLNIEGILQQPRHIIYDCGWRADVYFKNI